MSEDNVPLIQSFEDAFVAGDMDYILSILDDEITIYESDSVPYPGTFHGKEGFLEIARLMTSVWDITSDLDLEIMPAGDDRVLVIVEFDARSHDTGNPVTIRIAEIYTVRNNKISEIQVFYWDPKAMEAAIAA